jgi:hypothetical protein
MGNILSVTNLRSYASARYSRDLPGWRLGDMVHVKLPVLAYRDYALNYDEGNWPFCWHDKRHINAALRLTVTMLMSWQATRRRGGAKLILKRLEDDFPKIVRRLQKVLQQYSKDWFGSYGLKPQSTAHQDIVCAMATAVDEIAAIVETKSANPTRNPMFGSKVLSFFFPDFFPIWDTAWVKRALVVPLKGQEEDTVMRDLRSTAARGYAKYVNLMVTDAWETSSNEYKRLETECIRLCVRDGYDEAKRVLDQFYSLPVLFEACLLGRAAQKREF